MFIDLKGTKLNIGSGGYNLDQRMGWVNVDIRPDVKADIVTDVLEMQLTAQSLERIYCGHLVEHIPDPVQHLSKWYNWLKPKGRITIAVPDFQVVAAMFHGEHPKDPLPELTPERLVFGYTTPPSQRHLHAFSKDTLKLVMAAAGFSDIRPDPGCCYLTARVPWQLVMTGTRA